MGLILNTISEIIFGLVNFYAMHLDIYVSLFEKFFGIHSRSVLTIVQMGKLMIGYLLHAGVLPIEEKVKKNCTANYGILV